MGRTREQFMDEHNHAGAATYFAYVHLSCRHNECFAAMKEYKQRLQDRRSAPLVVQLPPSYVEEVPPGELSVQPDPQTQPAASPSTPEPVAAIEAAPAQKDATTAWDALSFIRDIAATPEPPKGPPAPPPPPATPGAQMTVLFLLLKHMDASRRVPHWQRLIDRAETNNDINPADTMPAIQALKASGHIRIDGQTITVLAGVA